MYCLGTHGFFGKSQPQAGLPNRSTGKHVDSPTSALRAWRGRSCPLETGRLGEIATKGTFSKKEEFAQEVFGSNLFLESKKARGCATKSWSLLLVAKMVGEMVGTRGLEPPRISPLDPKSSASANSATCPQPLALPVRRYSIHTLRQHLPGLGTCDKFVLHMQHKIVAHKIVAGSCPLVGGIRADQTPAGEERSRALETAGKGNGLVLDPSSVDSVRTNPYWGMNVVGSF